MLCEIYKGNKKEDTYAYLEAPADFEKMPEAIRKMFGELQRVMELEITESTKLAKENPVDVLNNIKENGFHIQLPPKDLIPDVI